MTLNEVREAFELGRIEVIPPSAKWLRQEPKGIGSGERWKSSR